jgi:hypothetical protein
MSRYPVPEDGAVDEGQATDVVGQTPDDPGATEQTDPVVPEDDLPDPGFQDLCGLPGLVLPVVESWEPSTTPRTLTLLLSDGDVLVEGHTGPLSIEVNGAAPPSAGPVWSGDHLVVDFINAVGAEMIVRVPPEVERLEIGVCTGEVDLIGVEVAEIDTLVEIGEVWAEALASPSVVVDNPVGDVGLAFAANPDRIDIHGGEGTTWVELPSETCDCDLQVSGPGVASLEDIAQDAAAPVEVGVHHSIGNIIVRGQP